MKKLLKTIVGIVVAFFACPDICCDGAVEIKGEPMERLLDAIEIVESGIDPNAAGDGGLAIGSFQLHKIYVQDVNRILGHKIFNLEARWNRCESRKMVGIYLRHYSKKIKGATLEDMARIHNGGPDGWRNDVDWFIRNRNYSRKRAAAKIINVKRYWRKVEKIMKRLEKGAKE